jgi:pentatricopeptide repeat protein
LLYGLVDGYANMKQLDKASEVFGRMQKQAKGSELMARAEKRARGEAVDGPAPCEQCHSR